jgi:putative hydrolase of the HAD superfamily
MSSYEGLIVDFGGVLTTPLEDAMQSFAESRGIDLQDLVRVALAAYHGEGDDLVVRFEKGHMDDAEFALEFARRLSETTGVDVTADRLLQDLLGTLRLEEEMIDAVRRAREGGIKTALLSNSWGLELYPRELLVEICDVVVISGEVGMRKPDRDIFDLTLERLKLEPEACVFVDDHPGHLKTAQEVGMKTVLHRTPKETVGELEELLELALSGSAR